MPTIPQIKANARRMLTACGAPLTATNLRRLAETYETGYRRNRASHRPSARHLLLGQIRTARAFYSLARNA